MAEKFKVIRNKLDFLDYISFMKETQRLITTDAESFDYLKFFYIKLLFVEYYTDYFEDIEEFDLAKSYDDLSGIDIEEIIKENEINNNQWKDIEKAYWDLIQKTDDMYHDTLPSLIGTAKSAIDVIEQVAIELEPEKMVKIISDAVLANTSLKDVPIIEMIMKAIKDNEVN